MGETIDWGSVPQWLTATIALCAFIAALISIGVQRATARRRAAFDLFLKTETDEKMITAFDRFHEGIAAMRAAPDVQTFCTSPSSREQYLNVRKYLNVHELVAVGIDRNVLDPKVCFSYWGDTLTNNYSDAQPVLDFLATRPKNKYTYSDLHKLNAKWVKQKSRS
ncbi:DUF4760 domain-containing protein [Bradyrhizobium sp. LHD-71]|uniref:DUF4760 domain-containing protein n=1 Tax=Bradyrhizobium sp. LHD-71 TaxID=3072141 RepID=UPI00280EF867|nr:DUF4760 domain-containing protein [Bradyrhizobium sp. LHD-71]MDQ8732440.1 DUF4760 domain-containing protein [Bradyrhizobium sp. LHD-71]